MIYFILMGEGIRLNYTIENLIWYQIRRLPDSNLRTLTYKSRRIPLDYSFEWLK